MPSSSPTTRVPVAILGAGLTGLGAAWHLQRAGVGHRLFERLGHVGGLATTAEERGYRFDRTGHLLHLRDLAWRSQVERWLGDDWLDLRRQSRIWSHGTYTRYPFQSNTHGLPPAVAHECVLGFVQAHFARHEAPPRDFEQFCRQTFGEGFSRHFMLPYNSRMWGVAPSEITSAWCQRFVPTPSLSDVIAGAVGLADRELGYNTTFLYPRSGIGALPEAIARELRDVELARSPVKIDFRQRRLWFADETVEYEALISTIPLPTLVALLDAPPDAVRQAAGGLRSTRLYYLDVALSAPCRQPWHWVYVPEEQYPFYRVGCYSNFSADLAPPGCGSLYVELVDRQAPDLAELLPRLGRDLVELDLICDPSDIAFASLRQIDPAYVVFDRHCETSLGTVQEFLDQSGIYSVGRYGGWNYSSMEDALTFGRDTARAVQQRLS